MPLNALFAKGNIGSWDQGMLLHALRGDLWPVPVTFRQTPGLIAPDAAGAVVVIAGRHMADEDGQRYLRAGLGRLPWAVIAHVGDEELVFPSEQFRYPARRLLIQCGNPFLPIRGDRMIPLAWPEDCRAWLRQQARRAASARSLWSFAGQRNHVIRDQMFEELEQRPRGEGALYATDGFGQGFDRAVYYASLAESSIIPCPAGNFSPETFRLYEALEAGCIPIPNRTATNGGWQPGFDYWPWAFGGPVPFPTVDRWSEVHPILDRYRDDPALLQRDMTRCLAWWVGQKRRYALDLVDDCRALGAEVPVPPVTTVMTMSPVPSHPSLEVIDDSISRIRAYPALARADVLVGIDGVRPDLEHRRNAYEEAKRVLVDRANWDPAWFGVCPVIFDEWVHQAAMTKELLKLVRTPLILFVEADTYPMGDIPWEGLIGCFDDPSVNYIRLHLFESVIPEHEPLYDVERREVNGVPLLATLQYSQRPHLARTEWYRKVMEKHFEGDRRSFIEDRVHGVAQEGALGPLYIYAPQGSMLRSGTSDGRGADPKAPHEV
jgi:hypothetical protein